MKINNEKTENEEYKRFKSKILEKYPDLQI